jgi:hypothetical protein
LGVALWVAKKRLVAADRAEVVNHSIVFASSSGISDRYCHATYWIADLHCGRRTTSAVVLGMSAAIAVLMPTVGMHAAATLPHHEKENCPKTQKPQNVCDHRGISFHRLPVVRVFSRP